MDTVWTWELPGYCAKYSFLTEPKGLTIREVERVFQLDPEPPVLENMNDYIIEAVHSRELCWFSFFLHHYENRLNNRVRRFLLREGLDLPEVSLVAILDADKEGFLRSETALIQTIGRAARNAGGQVIMYADTVTPSMRRAMDETQRRREKQAAYNKQHGIVPKTVIKSVRDLLDISAQADETDSQARKGTAPALTKQQKAEKIAQLEKQMKEAAKMLEFELAAALRDQIIELRGK